MCMRFDRCCAVVNLLALTTILSAVGGHAADPAAKPATAGPVRTITAAAAAAVQADVPQPTSGEKIEAALSRKVTLEFDNQPLAEIVQAIAKEHNINFQLHARSLEDQSIDTQTPITFRARDISLRSALHLIFSPLDCTVTVGDEVLQVVTIDYANTQSVTHCYSVPDLLAARNAFDEQVEDFGPLKQLIISTVAPTTWDEVGGPGSLGSAGNTLIVNQPREIQEQLADLLEQLRAARNTAGKKLPTSLGKAVQSDLQEQYKSLLARRVSWHFDQVPLSEVIESIAKETTFNMQLDRKSMEEASVADSTAVSLEVKDISLGSALRLLLKPLGLQFALRHEVLQIGAWGTECGGDLTTRVFPVGDLLDANEINADYEPLIASITATVHPTTWDEVGGPGAIVPFPPARALVITQQAEILDAIDALIESVRANRLAAQQSAKMVTKVYSLAAVSQPAASQPPARPETKPGQDKAVAANPSAAEAPANLPNAVCLTPPAAGMGALPASAVVGLIEEKIAHDSWNKQAQIRIVGDKLLITQTPAVHRRIARLTSALLNPLPEGACGISTLPGMPNQAGGGQGGGGGGGFFAVPCRP